MEDTKKCTACKIEKYISEFNKQKRGLFGVKSICKGCQSTYMESWRTKNEDSEKEKRVKYNKENAQKLKKRRKEWYNNNKERVCSKNNERRRTEHARDLARRRDKERRENGDIQYILAKNLRIRTRQALKGISKSEKTLELLDCTLEEFKVYLEKRWLPGMSWENYGYWGWHIDHIRPCADFDLTLEEAQRRCFNYTNLQPMWRKDNQEKGDTYLSLVERAELVAFAVHAACGHKRKYTGAPYIVHPVEVYEILQGVGIVDEVILAAALLHDVVEMSKMTIEHIQMEFGPPVAKLVEELTDISKPEDGNRAVRKAMDREHSAKASPDGKTIKLGDFLSNWPSIVENDPKFAKTYYKEKMALLPHLKEGDQTLYHRVSAYLQAYAEKEGS